MMTKLTLKKGKKSFFICSQHLMLETPNIDKSVINFEAGGTHFREEPILC